MADLKLTDAEERYLLDLYEKLDAAQQDGNEEAEIKAFDALQHFYISKETMPQKIGKAYESTMAGLNEGISKGVGLPVDISNLILAMGEKGVKKIMKETGFELSPDATIISPHPFGGGASVEKLFNKIGIKTDYDKTRLLTHITGRIAEEVGINIPLMALPLKGATPKNMAKIAGIETSAAAAAGHGAAWAQVYDPASEAKIPGTNIPANLEAWAMALGYLSPVTVMSTYKALDGMVGIKSGIDTIFRPQKTANKAAANILFSKLSDDDIAKLLVDLKRKNMTKEELFEKYGLTEDDLGSSILGDSVNQTNFPRLLDEVLDNDELTILRDQIMQRPEGLELAQALESYKLTRMIELENKLRKKIVPEEYTPVKKGDIIPGTVSLSVENRIKGINDYFSQRLALAETIAAEKMALVGPNLTRAQATKLLKQELGEALDDMLRQEKTLWGKVGNKVDTSTIGDRAVEILLDQFKTTPNASIPSILKKLAGEKRMHEAGLIQVPEKAVEGLKGGLLEGKQSVDELLNLKALVHDEIRRASKLGTKQGDILAENYSKILDEIDGSLTTFGSEETIEAANAALAYTNKMQKEIYDGSIGNILEYNVKKSADGIPQGVDIINAKKFEELMSKGEAGGVNSKDFLKIMNGESKAIQEKIKDDVARLIDTRTGMLPAKTLEKYLKDNEEIINMFPTLKKQLMETDGAKRLVEDRLQTVIQTEKDLAKYRSQTLLGNDQLGLSNNTIIKRIFSPKATKEDALVATDNIVKILQRGDDSGLALQGFQDSVTEFIFNSIKPVTKKGKQTLNLDKTISFINNNKDALIKIYGDDGYALWKEFSDTLEQVQPALLTGNVGKLDVFAKNNIIVSAIGRITGAKLGSAGLGPPLVLAGLGGRLANKLIGNKTESEIIRLLSKAFRDPEFAADLIKPLADDTFDNIQSNVNRFLKDDKARLTTGTRIGAEIGIEEDQTEPEEVPVSMNIPNEASRLSNVAMANPVGMQGVSTGAMDPNTMAKGQALFGGPNEITFASKGGIMSTNKAFQRVA